MSKFLNYINNFWLCLSATFGDKGHYYMYVHMNLSYPDCHAY